MDKKLASFRLNQIQSAWNNYFLEFKDCNSKIKYTVDVKSNYPAEISGSFNDMNDIIELSSKIKNKCHSFD